MGKINAEQLSMFFLFQRFWIDLMNGEARMKKLDRLKYLIEKIAKKKRCETCKYYDGKHCTKPCLVEYMCEKYHLCLWENKE